MALQKLGLPEVVQCLGTNGLIQMRFQSLTPKLLSYRNQSIDLQSKSIDWFLYDGNFGV